MAISGVEFLRFLRERGYVNDSEYSKFANPNLEYSVQNMVRTSFMSEDTIVSYLNVWGVLPVEVTSFENTEINLIYDIFEKGRLGDVQSDCIIPTEMVFNDVANTSLGGRIKVAVPYTHYEKVSIETVKRLFKTIYQSSAWSITLAYGLSDSCTNLLYKYSNKFDDYVLEQTELLTLKQKVQKIFRDAVYGGIMDILFLMTDGKIKVFFKQMNEYHQYKVTTFNEDDSSNLKNMLISIFGGVEGVKSSASEPSLDFKINNMTEDGKYEGRVNFMTTRSGYEFHIRIIKLEFNTMTLRDYNLNKIVRSQVLNALDETTGLILVTGPRGSGKQVFMYACINEYMKRNPYAFIETLEDPVEAKLSGNVAQVEIQGGNYNYNYYLRGIKRHSTNLYMFGELRDRETVEAVLTEAASAALIISTTHCADCAGIFKKMSAELHGDDALLVKLVNEFRVITNLTMARKICPVCAKQVTHRELHSDEQQFLNSWGYTGNIYISGGGCDNCKRINATKIGSYSSDGNIYEPLIVVECLKFDRIVNAILNNYTEIIDKENAIRSYMLTHKLYKTQIALSLMANKKISLGEVMKLFSLNNFFINKEVMEIERNIVEKIKN